MMPSQILIILIILTLSAIATEYDLKREMIEINLCNDQESHNTKEQRTKTKSSKYYGVAWSKRYKKWQASIKIRGKNKFGGYFDHEVEAAKAANQLYIKFELAPKNPEITGKPTIVNTKSSQYKGVHQTKNNQWYVQIQKGENYKFGGSFDNELDAARRVNQLCLEIGIAPKNPEVKGKPTPGSKLTRKKTSNWISKLNQQEENENENKIKGMGILRSYTQRDFTEKNREIFTDCPHKSKKNRKTSKYKGVHQRGSNQWYAQKI